MRPQTSLLVITIALAIAGPHDLDGQSALGSRLAADAALLQASDSHARSQAFYDLLDSSSLGRLAGRTDKIPAILADLFQREPSSTDGIKHALIYALETENADDRTGTQITEEVADYRGDLIAAVGALHDEDALPVLLPNLTRGRIAREAVGSLGSAAVTSVLAADDGTMLTRQAVVMTLGAILDSARTAPLGPAASTAIKAALLRAVEDESHWVRDAAVDGLAKIPGSDVSATLREIADHDPYVRTVGNATEFPTRLKAQKALEAQSRLGH